MSRAVAFILASVAAVALMLLCARDAAATPNFPGALAAEIGGPAPDCSICHVCGVTGRGTVNTPWGAAMRARGLQAYDEQSLRAAVAKMRADGIDSDGDGTIDVDALKEGKDPNPPTCDEEGDPTIPRYGCIGRVSPSSSIPTELPFIVVAAVACAAIVQRRRARKRSAHGAAGLVAIVGVSALSALTAACAAPQSGAGLAPRRDDVTTPRAAEPPQMRPTARSAFAAELRSVDLDPANLPKFEDLSPRQLRRVMSTFTRSLGIACTDCHDQQDHRRPTGMMAMTRTMWNDLTRPYALAEGGALYCDSCHQGQARFLARDDKQRVSAFMADNFVGKLGDPKQVAANDPIRHPKRLTVECESCHGDPFQPLFLPRP